MNIPTILAIAVLGSVAANLIHWRWRKDEHFNYQPQSAFLRFLFLAWTIATVVASVLFLVGTIPAPAFLGIAFGLTIAHELYSIARRQTHRARL
jgi:hypothetical protein